MCILLMACGNNAPKQVETPSPKTAETTTPVTESTTAEGNAQLMAEWIADEEGCDTYELLTEEKYPTDYREITTVAKNEQNDNARPALSNHIDDIDSYSKIYIVYPN